MKNFKERIEENNCNSFEVECENIKAKECKSSRKSINYDLEYILYIIRDILVIIVVISLFSFLISSIAKGIPVVKNYIQAQWNVVEENSYDIYKMEYFHTPEFKLKYIDDDSGKVKNVSLKMELDKIEEEYVYISDSNKIYIKKLQKVSDLRGKEEKEEITKLELTKKTYEKYFNN